MIDSRKVSREIAERAAQKRNISFIETSAKEDGDALTRDLSGLMAQFYGIFEMLEELNKRSPGFIKRLFRKKLRSEKATRRGSAPTVEGAGSGEMRRMSNPDMSEGIAAVYYPPDNFNRTYFAERFEKWLQAQASSESAGDGSAEVFGSKEYWRAVSARTLNKQMSTDSATSIPPLEFVTTAETVVDDATTSDAAGACGSDTK